MSAGIYKGVTLATAPRLIMKLNMAGWRCVSVPIEGKRRRRAGKGRILREPLRVNPKCGPSDVGVAPLPLFYPWHTLGEVEG